MAPQTNGSAEEDLDNIELSYDEEQNDQPGSPLKEENVSTNDNENENSKENDSTTFPVGDIFCCFKKGAIKSPLDPLKLLIKWLVINKTQILSGVTVALAQVPEAVSFSFVAGVDPIVGLQSAWIMGLVTSLFGGRPGMVAGATGAVAVVLTGLVRDYGLGYLFYAIMLAGIIQMLFGLFRLGKLIRLVPHPVMVGFCNGLGIVIGVAQFNIFKVRPDDASASSGSHRGLMEIAGAFAPFTNGYPWVDWQMGLWMTFQIAVTLLVYIVWPQVTKRIPALGIPGSLAAIIISTAVEWGFIRQIGYYTNTVADLASVSGTFPVPVWLDPDYSNIMPPINGTTIGIILPTAITAAAIGILESLLTLQIIDELTNTKGNSDREAFGQGLGQFLSGMLGGMGGCTTIGQSMMNIHSGGYTRLSSTVAGLFMLLIILVAHKAINLIPIASLAGVMFVVTYFTIEWESAWIVLASMLPQKLRIKYGLNSKVKRSDVVIMLIVVAVTLVLDLAIAVGVGILIATLVFAWDAGTRISMKREVDNEEDTVYYTISGPIFFGSSKPLMSLFPNPNDEPKNVVIFLEHAEVYDWSGMVTIKAIHERLGKAGCTVKFEKLTASSHRLMNKSMRLWEGINVFAEEDKLDFENDPLIHTNLHAAQRVR